MRALVRTTLILLCSITALAVEADTTREIYRWVDDDGVVHFSDEAPPTGVEGMKRIMLEEPGPGSGPVDDDPFNVEATAERMQAYRDELAQRREAQRAARLERERIAAQRPVVQYQPVGRAYPWYLNPPLYPVNPIEPPPPTPEPYPTVPFRPPGGLQN